MVFSFKKQITILLLILMVEPIYAQELGARLTGLGKSGSSIFDAEAINFNVGGISQINHLIILATYQNQYLLPEFNTFSAAILGPVKKGVAAISLKRFGDHYYSKNKINLTFAHEIRNVSLGLQTQLIINQNLERKNEHLLLLKFGGIIKLSSNLNFGAYIHNFLAPFFNQSQQEDIILSTGITYTPTPPLLLTVEVSKNMELKEDFRLGLEYNFYRKLYARTGISSAPYKNYFGLGFNHPRIVLNYALIAQDEVGYSQQLSVSYLLPRRN
ncbi:hypothetical protein [Xanthovirga aplysinae]|uniref:hypothetical protein n=1 Tax=Xanthovirga aplysinae TaxID=2529853 RepID=UPI0012BC1659|nr:hypothetical protein [Xanthovirga aplysinae]MTI30751.1 hypothetical protein [Xanthovirga aplysinae]